MEEFGRSTLLLRDRNATAPVIQRFGGLRSTVDARNSGPGSDSVEAPRSADGTTVWPEATSAFFGSSDLAMPRDVFIGHAQADKLIAGGVCNRLEAAGIHCWIAPRDTLSRARPRNVPSWTRSSPAGSWCRSFRRRELDSKRPPQPVNHPPCAIWPACTRRVWGAQGRPTIARLVPKSRYGPRSGLQWNESISATQNRPHGPTTSAIRPVDSPVFQRHVDGFSKSASNGV